MKFIVYFLLALDNIHSITSAFTLDKADIEEFIDTSRFGLIPRILRLASTPPGIVNSKVGSEGDAKYLFDVVGLAYCPKSAIEASNGTYSKKLTSGFKVLKVFEDEKFKTQSFLAEVKEKKQLVMSFRGTNNQENWKMNLELERVPLNDATEQDNSNSKKRECLDCDVQPKLINGVESTKDCVNQLSTEVKENMGEDNEDVMSVHSGFKKITDSMAPVAIDYLKKLYNQPEYRNHTLVVTGHSLGAAVATLSIIQYQSALQLPWNRIHLVTYGSPRVGNNQFANYLNSKPITSTRVTNENDPIPKLPDLGYTHIQSELYIKGNQTIFCRTDKYEDILCSAGDQLKLDKDAHNSAWGLLMEDKYC